MKLTGNIKGLSEDYGTAEMVLSLKINEKRDLLEGYDELFSKEKISIELKPFKEKRSLNANAYLWKLIGELAAVLNLGNEEVYRHYIRDMGVYEIIPVRSDAVERFCVAWRREGIGWLAEPMRDSKLVGYVNVMCFYGSSVYDKSEFSRILNQVVEDCKIQGIQTEPQEKIDAIVEAYFGEKHNTDG